MLLHLPMPVIAHGGSVDSYGCHNDRQRGEYHCHQGPLAGRSFSSQAEMLRARNDGREATPLKGTDAGKVSRPVPNDSAAEPARRAVRPQPLQALDRCR
jgi:hypothetical protein